MKDSTPRDILAFDVKSDKICKDAKAPGNTVSFNQVYNLAKVEGKTKSKMKFINQGEYKSDLHAACSSWQQSFKKNKLLQKQFSIDKSPSIDHTGQRGSSRMKAQEFPFMSKGCFRYGNKHIKSACCPAEYVKCSSHGKTGNYIGYVWKNTYTKYI